MGAKNNPVVTYGNCIFNFLGLDAMGLEDSDIIGKNAEQLNGLGEWLKSVTPSDRHWKLCWRASENGWGATTFHSLCDGKGPTVSIIKVDKYIFGGYTSTSWSEWHKFLPFIAKF